MEMCGLDGWWMDVRAAGDWTRLDFRHSPNKPSRTPWFLFLTSKIRVVVQTFHGWEAVFNGRRLIPDRAGLID
jgi:hypothetical protein